MFTTLNIDEVVLLLRVESRLRQSEVSLGLGSTARRSGHLRSPRAPCRSRIDAGHVHEEILFCSSLTFHDSQAHVFKVLLDRLKSLGIATALCLIGLEFRLRSCHPPQR